ncbi:MAG: hypothetical protein N2554_07940 [Fimbriimonadales bacterium]|nr:hypothetical protein [Fimbriimonadales bacterium]
MQRHRYTIISVAGVLGLAFWLAGCGGGGGGGGDNNLPGTPVQVSIQNAQWVAFQDGSSGAWQTLSGAGNFSGAPRVTAADGRYSIAYVCSGAKPTVHVVHTTLAEAPQFNATCGGDVSSTVPVSGSVQGLNGAQALIAIGEATGVPVGNLYNIPNVRVGIHDVVAVRLASGVPNRVWLQRGRQFTSATNYNIDFNQADGSIVRVFDVSSGTMSVAGIDTGANENVTAQVFLQSAVRGSIIGLGTTILDGAVARYPIIPSALLGTGESFRVKLVTSEARGIEEVATTLPSSLSYTLPAPFTSPSFSVNSTGEIVVDVAGFSYSESPVRGYLLELSGSGQPVRYQILISSSWLGNANTYSTPVLSTLSGWNAGWTLQRGQSLDVGLRVLVAPNSVPAGAIWTTLQGSNPPVGFQLRYATRRQTINP